MFGGVDFGFNFGGGLFDSFFGRRQHSPTRGANIEVNIAIPLEKVASGGEETVRYGRLAPCSRCHGYGTASGTPPKDCDVCHGSGKQVKSHRKGNVVTSSITTCPACHGNGKIIEQACADCAGRGEVEKTESLTITIPVGVEDGMALRVEGRGMASPEPGGQPGDLYVVIRSQDDPRFQRMSADLWREETLPLVDAVLGTKLDVPVPDGGSVQTNVPAGTQPDTVLRLRGKGLPRFGGGHRGELYVRVKVQVPEKISREERELYEQLRALSGKAKKHFWD